MVGVAQLVEPRIVIPAVVGSSPIVHPTPTRESVSDVGTGLLGALAAANWCAALSGFVL